MSPTPSPGAAPADPVTFPSAELDRRFTAFLVDRALGWGIAAGVAYLVWAMLDDRVWVALLTFAGTTVLLGALLAVLVGTTGLTPGKALVGLRVVRRTTGRPIGVLAALGRGCVLGLAGLPTVGLGLATLAWTAAADPGRQRRGLHDRFGEAVVVDVRPVPVVEEEAGERPQQIVNLTAMRLVPVAAPEPVEATSAGRSAPSVAPALAAVPPVTVPPVPVPSAARPAAGVAPPPVASPVAPKPVTPPTPAAPVAPTPPAVPPAPRAPAPMPASPPARPAARPAAPARPIPASPAAGSAGAAGPGQAPRMPVEQTQVRGAHSGGAAVSGAAASGAASGAVEATAAPRWRVTFDTGEVFVVEGLALVGRRPEARPGEPVRHVVPLRSADMSLSKTHAQFQVAPDGALVVMDRGSTNGSFVTRGDAAKQLTPGRPSTLLPGDVVRFGDRTMRVERDD
ncbi:RDD family protein [Nocardioides faecalis]|nr:RDD family protein [Nocardioides faecalis]QVI58310.1 RDD family protein [Nocardioides faecalis]